MELRQTVLDTKNNDLNSLCCAKHEYDNSLKPLKVFVGSLSKSSLCTSENYDQFIDDIDEDTQMMPIIEKCKQFSNLECFKEKAMDFANDIQFLMKSEIQQIQLQFQQMFDNALASVSEFKTNVEDAVSAVNPFARSEPFEKQIFPKNE